METAVFIFVIIGAYATYKLLSDVSSASKNSNAEFYYENTAWRWKYAKALDRFLITAALKHDSWGLDRVCVS